MLILFVLNNSRVKDAVHGTNNLIEVSKNLARYRNLKVELSK